MKEIEETLITEYEIKMGEEMSYITFAELVQELTGAAFDDIYRDHLIHGANDYDESNLE